jgi:hypothetical protein
MASKKIWSFVFLAFITASRSGHAAPNAAERETARRLMDEGKARMKEKDHARAVDLFQRAHDIMHVPTTGIALARAHLAAGHLVEARDAALEVGRMPREGSEPAVFENARKQAKELDAQLKPRIPMLRVKIKGGNVSRVAIDDVEIPPAIVGEPVAVNPGKRIVTAKSGEAAEARGEIELAERESKEIELVLPHESGKALAATSSSSTSPPTPATTSTKVYGFGNDEADFGQRRTPLANGLMLGGAGLGAASLVVGSITGAMTLSKSSDLTQQCENDICAPSARDGLDSANTLATVSTIGFIAAGIGVTAAVVGFLLPKQPAKTKASGSLWIGAAGLGGSF